MAARRPTRHAYVQGFFGTDDLVLASAQRLRALRSIPLDIVVTDPEPHLEAFREAEVWESEELLNRALTPIACGDVFELDQDEQGTKTSKQKFILLAQPCDISRIPAVRAALPVEGCWLT